MEDDDLTDEFFERPNDYCKAILASNLAEIYELTPDAVQRIDFLLNRYHIDDDAPLRKHQQFSRKEAPALLQHLSTALNESTAKIQSLSENKYALSAIFAVLPEQFGGTPNQIDNLIDRFNELAFATAKLAEIAEQASEQLNFSDGLPVFKRGAEPDPGLDVLIQSLATAIPEIIQEAIELESGTKAGDSSIETTNSRIAPFIAEILAIGGIELTEKAVYNRLSLLSR